MKSMAWALFRPNYVDVAIERWQSFTGQEALLAETGESFAALKAKRLAA